MLSQERVRHMISFADFRRFIAFQKAQALPITSEDGRPVVELRPTRNREAMEVVLGTATDKRHNARELTTDLRRKALDDALLQIDGKTVRWMRIMPNGPLKGCIVVATSQSHAAPPGL